MSPRILATASGWRAGATPAADNGRGHSTARSTHNAGWTRCEPTCTAASTSTRAADTVQVSDLASTWSAGLSHLKESTAARYRGIVKVHVLPAFGGWQVDEVRRSDVQAWVERLTANGKAPGTVRQCHRTLSLILDTAVDDNRIARNPAYGVKLPRQRRAEPRFLDAAEVARMVDAAGAHGPAVAILALCGLRFGELAALRVRDVDPGRRRFTVAGSVTEVAGRLVRSDPKTGRTRSVPYPATLAPMVSALVSGQGPDEELVTAPEGGTLRLRNWRTRVFDPAALAIGRTDITPHDLGTPPPAWRSRPAPT